MVARRFERPNKGYLSDNIRQTRWGDKFLTQLETSLDDIETVQTEQADQQAEIVAAQAEIVATQTELTDTQADLADTVADLVDLTKKLKIGFSWTSPGSILTAADVGSDCTITIAAHTRKYGDGTSVAVNGGSVTGVPFSSKRYIYYDDTGLAGGAVTYVGTNNPNNAAPNAVAGRHFCGFIETPADGAGSVTGGPTPPGGDYGGYTNIP